MNKPLVALAACLVCAAASTAASAQSAAPGAAQSRFAIGVGGGTNGGSVEAAYSINPYLTVRAQGAYLDFDADFKSSETTYKGTLTHKTGGALVDLHPFQNPFFAAAGVVSGQRRVNINAVPTSAATFRLNGVSYSAAQVVSVNGKVELGDTAPIVGLGYDNTFTHAGHWGVRAFAGAIIGDSPKVTLTPAGPLATNATVLANVATEQALVQRDADDYRYYPVVSVGVFYRF